MRGVLILTEGGKKTGFGHVTRCQALQEEFRQKGFQVNFWVNGDESVRKIAPDADLVNWHGSSLWNGPHSPENAFVVADSYLAAPELLAEIASAAYRVLYLDDNNRLAYPRGYVVNPSLYGLSLPYERRPGITYLGGPEYVILRSPFRKPFSRQIRPMIRTVTVIMGGTDPLGLTPRIVSRLLEAYPGLEINVVLGLASKDSELFARARENVVILHNLNASALCELFQKSDLVISAAGQTSYELIQLRTPSVLIPTADNQRYNVEGMAKHELALIFELKTELSRITELVDSLTPAKRTELAARMSAFDFSCGAARIVEAFTQ